jgi:hypothetical protein
MRDKKELASYIDGYERDENAPPDMRGGGANVAREALRTGAARRVVAAKAAAGRKKRARR